MYSSSPDVNAALNALKPADIANIKVQKSPPACIKLAFAAMCVIVGVTPEKLTDPQAKKNVGVGTR